MPDKEKVLRGWDRCSKCLYPSMFDQQFKDCEYTMGMYCGKDKLISETVELLKEQDETIKELQNAYGYLQKQFFEAQDKLLKEQDYRGWLMDMFHKYGRDDLIALLVLHGEENLLTDLLKEQEGHWIVLDFCANEGIYCSECHMKIFDRTTKPKKKLSQYCPHCGSRNEQFFRDGEVVFR